MKVLRVRLAGFGPFRTEQLVDLERFDDAGLFLIGGRTGAGKSTVLDAVHFALFGGVPRYEATAGQVRSQHAGREDPTFVELDFAVRGHRYRLRRSPEYERPHRRDPSRTTREAAKAELLRWDGSAWQGVATRATDVAAALHEVLPISREQFLQVILLAQGDFERFLVARTEDRVKLLRALFGTERFQQLEESLLERSRSLGSLLESTRAAVLRHAAAIVDERGGGDSAEPDEEWFRAAADATAATAHAAERAAGAARAASAAADVLAAQVADERARQQRRDSAAARLAALDQDAERIGRLRVVLAAAERATRVLPTMRAAEAARHETGAARRRSAAAEAAYEKVRGADRALASEAVPALERELGRLEPALDDERRADGLDAAAVSAHVALRDHDAAVTEQLLREEALPSRIADLGERIEILVAVAATAPGLEAEAARARDALDAAELAASLRPRLARAVGEQTAAATALAAAAQRHAELLRGLIDGRAADLAGSLVPGAACPVCGALEHPAPAPPRAEPVDEAAVEAAASAAERSAAEVAARAAAVADAREALAAATARSGGLSPDAANGALDRLSTSLGEARAAKQRGRALEADRDALRDERDRMAAARLSEQADRERLVEEHDGARRDRDAAAARVRAARGADADVAARVLRVQRSLAAAQEVAAAERAAAEAGRTDAAAAAALADLLHATAFDDAEAVQRAALDAPAVAEHTEAVRAHDAAVAGARSVLDEPGSAGLPEQPIDAAPAAAAARAARAALDTALHAAGVAVARRDAVGRAAAEAQRLLVETADRVREHALVRELAQTVHGDDPNTRRMRLETYVLAAQLEAILLAANRRFSRMTGGRYSLLLDDEVQWRRTASGLGIQVLDAHTGRTRPTASLSGGEKFLAALALALGLAEVVSEQAGGIALDTLFIDEGFGSLDGAALDVAMAAIEDLRAGGRTVGVISHVEQMQERIAARLDVVVLASGESMLRQPEPALD